MNALALLLLTALSSLGAANAFAPVCKNAARPNNAQAAKRSDYSTCAAPSSSSRLHMFDFLKGTGDAAASILKTPSSKPPPPKYDAVTIDPDYRVAGLFLALGAALDTIPYVQWTLGLVTTALGLLFLVQTFRIRFVFDEENCLELKTARAGSEELKDAGENVVVGGANRWACDTIVNYDFFPKGWIDGNPVGPILVYFKETQTPSESWNEGPGRSANDPDKIAAGQAVAGQVHFFPAVCNSQQIRAEFEKRGCGKIEA